MPISPTHLRWARDKRTGKERVTFGNFVSHFNVADRQSASDAFTLLIRPHEIGRVRREKLQEPT